MILDSFGLEKGEEMADIVSAIPSPSFSENFASDEKKDLFSDKRSKWDHSQEPRTDFAPHRIRLAHRNIWFHSVWHRSPLGIKFSDIKADDNMVPRFADHISALITNIFGENLDSQIFAVVAAPRRRHRERNFGHLIGKAIADRLGLQFFEDCAIAKDRTRVEAVFLPGNIPPQRHIFVIDDIVTTGYTLKAMQNLLTEFGKNTHFFAGINNQK